MTSIVTVHTLGVAGMAINAKATLGQAFLADCVFYPGDIIKNILAAGIAVALHRAFPDILVRRSAAARTCPARQAANERPSVLYQVTVAVESTTPPRPRSCSTG